MSEIKQHWQKIELNEILSISSKKFNPISNNENKKCGEIIQSKILYIIAKI